MVVQSDQIRDSTKNSTNGIYKVFHLKCFLVRKLEKEKEMG